MWSVILACVLSGADSTAADATAAVAIALARCSSPIEVPVSVKAVVKHAWGIVDWRPGVCPSCPATPIYGWVETQTEPTQEESDAKAVPWPGGRFRVFGRRR